MSQVVQRARSWEMLSRLRDHALSKDERMAAFGQLLELNYGFWQHDRDTAPQSLRSFARAAAQIALAKADEFHARRAASDVDDRAHDLLIHLFENADQIRRHPRNWMIGSLVRMVLNDIKMNWTTEFAQSIESIALDVPDPASCEPGESSEPQSTPEWELLHEATKTLSPRCQEILEWKYERDLKAPEIARLLKTTPAAIRTELARARRAIRDYMKARGTPRRKPKTGTE